MHTFNKKQIQEQYEHIILNSNCTEEQKNKLQADLSNFSDLSAEQQTDFVKSLMSIIDASITSKALADRLNQPVQTELLKAIKKNPEPPVRNRLADYSIFGAASASFGAASTKKDDRVIDEDDSPTNTPTNRMN